MTSRISAVLLLLIAIAAPAAADTGSSNILIPIAGRTAGAYGSQWYTNLIITNLKPAGVSVIVTYYPTASEYYSFTAISVPGYGTVELNDVVGTTFTTTGVGMLRVSSATPDARLLARAYVYNRGAGGEFGQSVNGFAVDALKREHILSGLGGGEGRRTNVGFANPWPVQVKLVVEMFDKDGQPVGTIYPTVAPHDVVQINDIFATMGVFPAGPSSLRVTSTTGVSLYPYASIVRTDTGDATFVSGSGLELGNQNLVAPRCTDPAALVLARPGQSAGDWIVIFDSATANPDYVRNVIVPRHGVVVKHYFEHAFVGFAANLTQQQIAALRCETAALVVEENQFVPVP